MHVVLVHRVEAEHVKRHHVGVGVPPQAGEVGEQLLARSRRHLIGFDLVHFDPTGNAQIGRVGGVGDGKVEIAGQLTDGGRAEINVHGGNEESTGLFVVSDVDVGE